MSRVASVGAPLCHVFDPFSSMNQDHDDQEQHPPRWVPYTPPAPDGWDRVRDSLRRLSFPFVILLFGGAFVGVLLYWSPEPEPVQDTAPSWSVLSSGTDGGDGGEGAGQLQVQSEPAGATVRVNGDSVGVTPFADSSRPAGVYMLSVQQDGHFRADTVVVLGDGATASVRLALRQRPDYEGSSPERASRARRQPSGTDTAQQDRSLPVTSVPESVADTPPKQTPAFGSLYVTSAPTGAVVSVNGNERGRTPVPLSKINPGTQRVTVSLDGYQPWSTQVRVQVDTTARVHAPLQPQTGRLRVLARPWGTIYIDDTLHARESDVWYETELPIGTHQITVVHPVLGKQTRQVTVEAEAERSVVVDLREEGEPSSPQ